MKRSEPDIDTEARCPNPDCQYPEGPCPDPFHDTRDTPDTNQAATCPSCGSTESQRNEDGVICARCGRNWPRSAHPGSADWRDEDERIRAWRWIGDDMPPGPWQLGPLPAADDRQFEFAFFVAEARAAEAERERDELIRDRDAVQVPMYQFEEVTAENEQLREALAAGDRYRRAALAGHMNVDRLRAEYWQARSALTPPPEQPKFAAGLDYEARALRSRAERINLPAKPKP